MQVSKLQPSDPYMYPLKLHAGFTKNGHHLSHLQKLQQRLQTEKPGPWTKKASPWIWRLKLNVTIMYGPATMGNKCSAIFVTLKPVSWATCSVSVDIGIRRQSYRFENTDLPFEAVKDGVLSSFPHNAEYLTLTEEPSPFLLQHLSMGRLVKEVRKKAEVSVALPGSLGLGNTFPWDLHSSKNTNTQQRQCCDFTVFWELEAVGFPMKLRKQSLFFLQ